MTSIFFKSSFLIFLSSWKNVMFCLGILIPLNCFNCLSMYLFRLMYLIGVITRNILISSGALPINFKNSFPMLGFFHHPEDVRSNFISNISISTTFSLRNFSAFNKPSQFALDNSCNRAIDLPRKIGVSIIPIHASDLIRQDRAFYPPGGKYHLKRIIFYLRRDWAGEHQPGLFVVEFGRNHEHRPAAGLLVASCGVEINPNHIASIGNIANFYHISLPTGETQSIKGCLLFFVILLANSLSVGSFSFFLPILTGLITMFFDL